MEVLIEKRPLKYMHMQGWLRGGESAWVGGCLAWAKTTMTFRLRQCPRGSNPLGTVTVLEWVLQLRIHLLRLADSKQATHWSLPQWSDACDALKQPRQCNPICPPKAGVVPPWTPFKTEKYLHHTHFPVNQGGAEMPGRKLENKAEPTITQHCFF